MSGLSCGSFARFLVICAMSQAWSPMRSRSMMMSSMAAMVRKSLAMGCCKASRLRQFVSMRTLRSSM